MSKLSHLDDDGNAVMVDVSEKDGTERVAVAQGIVTMAPETLTLVQEGKAKKGDVLGVARLAGIMAAKQTAELIPLCHPLPLDSVIVELVCDPSRDAVTIEATVKVRARTGVEMEALTAVSVAALTVYDMLKAVDRAMVIGPVKLLHKSGGASGTYDAAGS